MLRFMNDIYIIFSEVIGHRQKQENVDVLSSIDIPRLMLNDVSC